MRMMVGMMGSKDAANENPSIPAADDGIASGKGIRPHPDLPFEERHPALVDYQPDLTGKVEGDQSVS